MNNSNNNDSSFKASWKKLEFFFTKLLSLDLFRKRKKCPYCLDFISKTTFRAKEKATIPQCSSCGIDLPVDFFTLQSRVIALVGGTDTAKSTYITVLVHQLLSNRSLLNALNLQALIVNKEGKKKYNTQYQKLFVNNEPLETTNRIDAQSAPPIVIRLRKTNTKRKEVMFISLFDTPGDEFNDPDLISEFHPHIANADALIFMIDPLNIQSIFDEIRPYIPKEADVYEEGLYHVDVEIIDNLLEVLGREQKITLFGKVQMPVAFCISKVDLLEPIMNVYIPEEVGSEMLNAGEVFEEIQYTSEDLFEFLQEHDPSLVNGIESQFEEYGFFPVAPMGKTPIGHTIKDGIEPKGILHPLLWILKKIKFV